MSVKITPRGEEIIRAQIAALESKLKQVRMDKNKAYHACGDQKLANPNFHKLEQEEQLLLARIAELKNLYRNAELIHFSRRNTDAVDIGSIVKCSFQYPDGAEEEIYEIVGYGESNIEENKLYYETPVARKLLGLKAGEETILSVPSGQVRCTVLQLYNSWEEAENL